MRNTLISAIAGAAILASSSAFAGAIGPTQYLQFAGSDLDGLSFTWFHLENFEDGLLDTPGVTAPFGSPIGPGGLIDSVDEEDGVVDGNGNGGKSFFDGNGQRGITFIFDEITLGSLPTHAGVVWTDGSGNTHFEAFDGLGNSLGTIGPAAIAQGGINGETDEDHFFGWMDTGGIGSIRIYNTAGGIEVDHLQYGLENSAPVPVPAPLAMMAGGLVLAGIGAARRKRQAAA